MENPNNNNFGIQSYENPIAMSQALANMLPGDLIFVKSTSSPVNGVNIKIDGATGGDCERADRFLWGEKK